MINDFSEDILSIQKNLGNDAIIINDKHNESFVIFGTNTHLSFLVSISLCRVHCSFSIMPYSPHSVSYFDDITIHYRHDIEFHKWLRTCNLIFLDYEDEINDKLIRYQKSLLIKVTSAFKRLFLRGGVVRS